MGDIVCKNFGKRIRLLRMSAGLSQEQLANLCDLDRTYIGGIERGERNPALKNIYRLAKALDVSLSNLFESI
ncbi:helix-turn-helix domain-containing protein [Pseudomonas putida]|uniref:helix-turn-helix domain-containing protein n=2 Tax=Pseudomonas TaxID=286 RepID=UPI002236B113|nr:helix-turn-helix transcriptional regulator [Pseudomonas putida]